MRSRAFGSTWIGGLRALLLACVPGLLGSVALALRVDAVSSPAADHQQGQDPAVSPEDLERLRAMLSQPGADGREARETAIERLLAMPVPAAHRVLHDCLLREQDPDGLRPAILAALQRHLVANALFGGAAPEPRRQILVGYVTVLAPWWQPAEVRDVDAAANPLRNAARLALQRVPVRELEGVARNLLAVVDDSTKAALFFCLADMQQLYLAPVLADFLEVPQSPVRDAARQSLQLLTYHEEEFASKAQFEAWYAQYGNLRYVDLAERAARRAPRRAERLREENGRLRVEAAREFVRGHITRAPGLDWAAIQLHTLVDDPAILDACLELLQQAFAGSPPPDEQNLPRQTFCRALIQRWRQVAPDQLRRRALLLEVAAYVARLEEGELATELAGLLLAQLEAPSLETRIAALRGLRRFPTVDTRGRLVRYASALLEGGAAAQSQLEAVLATLATRSAPRWYAPAPLDGDKAEWLGLVKGVCACEWATGLRDAALNLALTLDVRDQRLPEVFTLLLDFARDTSLEPKFRSTCMIHLQGWRDQQAAADALVRALLQLLDDPAVEMRQLAAESLAKLPESVDARRGDWITLTIVALRNRLRTEPNAGVLRALVDSMQVCGREPQMPEKAIGALNHVVADLGYPVPPEHQFRLELLLQALATIGADARADRGQWLGACSKLLLFGQRQSLRLVLQSHGAIELAKDVASAEGALADRAVEAMRVVIGTALLKPVKEGWASSPDLQREALDVRVAFGALNDLEESKRLDEPQHRLLRLEVELAAGRFQEAAQRANAWLATATNPTAPRQAMSVEQRDRMRMLAAEALLGLAKPDAAAKLLGELEAPVSGETPILELQGRIAKAWFAADPAAAVALLDRTLRATAAEDPAFRSRLVDWAQARVRHDPGTREATLAEVDRHAALFAAQDCPPDLREAVLQLRGPR